MANLSTKSDPHLRWVSGSYSVVTVSVYTGSSFPWKYSAPESRYGCCDYKFRQDDNSRC